MEKGDLAEVVQGLNEGTSHIFKYLTYLNEEVSYGDIVVILKPIPGKLNLNTMEYTPPLYKVRNTQNDKTFFITHDKLEPVTEMGTKDWIITLDNSGEMTK